MLASQESVLRSQPSEADYRAATVKQRPTSRRITPAEISVSAPTHCTLADSICDHVAIHSDLIWHITYSKTPGLHSIMQHYKHVRLHCFVLLCSWYSVYSLAEALKSLKRLLVLLCCSLCLRDKGWLYTGEVFTQALREVTYHYQRGCPGPSLLVKQSAVLYIFKSGEW